MTIPPQISALIDQINRELNQLDQEVQDALRIIRPLLNRFPDNAVLIQLFGALNNFQFFGSTRRTRIEALVSQISPADFPSDAIAEAGEELATILGEAMEARMNANNIKRRLERLS